MPLETLKDGTLMRRFLDKYMTLDGQPVGQIIVHPNNLQGIYLAKVLADGVSRKIGCRWCSLCIVRNQKAG